MSHHAYQARLGTALAQLFHGHDIKENVRKEAGITSGKGMFLELDYWIPSLNIAFEYQDPYHYKTTWFQTSTAKVQTSDRDKIVAVNSRKETLIPIPYWWDGNMDSLVATIKQIRPDLLSDIFTSVDPISIQPPESANKEFSIPGIGELMLASFPSPTGDECIPLESWWVSEKYDGVRACWSPLAKSLFSRFGRSLNIPPFGISLNDQGFLDGELWFGRAAFQESYQLFQHSAQFTNAWMLRMNVFDLPGISYRSLPFESRYQSLLQTIRSCHPFLILIANIKSKNTGVSLSSATRFKSIILGDNGEGIILRLHASQYHSGRSPSLLKVKAHRDQDGMVIGSVETNMPSIILPSELAYLLLYNGEKCIAANNSGDVIVPGDIVNFTHELLAGKTRTKCSIQRKRNDLEWTDIVNTETEDLNTAYKDKSETYLERTLTRKPPGYWTISEDNIPSNVRLFFDKIAEDNDIDGTIPENWFSFTKRDILREDGGGSILKHFSNSLRLALASAYPETIGAVVDDFSFRTGFLNLPTNFWQDKWRRKQFLLELAAQRGHSATDLYSWEKISEEEFIKTKGGASFMRYCARQKKTLVAVVKDCFNINSDESLKAVYLPEIKPISKQEMRSFFEIVADSLGFDPALADNWYANFHLVKDTVMSDKRGTSILNRYSGSLSKTLLALFPELNLVDSSLVTPANSKRQGQAFVRKRSFFESLSRKQRFDPLVPENWYRISRETILCEKGSEKILSSDPNVSSLLQEAFPEIYFVPSKFLHLDG